MGLPFRILKWLYCIVSTSVQVILTDDPCENRSIVCNNLMAFVIVLGILGIILCALVWAVSYKIFCLALLGAYIEAWIWERFSSRFTSFVQEIYLTISTIGYVVLVGATIQIQRMPWTNIYLLVLYWFFLLVFGCLIWLITVHNVSESESFLPKLAIKKIEYQHHFRTTEIPNETPSSNPVQAYLKKLKLPERDSRS